MALGEGKTYCNDCKTWHATPFEHELLQAMMRPIKVDGEESVDDRELILKEKNVLVATITEWLYQVKIGYRPEEERRKLAEMIQAEGFRVD